MKEYKKPMLQGLGLLRVVTQLSDPAGSGTGAGSENSHDSHNQWYEHGHGLPGEVI